MIFCLFVNYDTSIENWKTIPPNIAKLGLGAEMNYDFLLARHMLACLD